MRGCRCVSIKVRGMRAGVSGGGRVIPGADIGHVSGATRAKPAVGSLLCNDFESISVNSSEKQSPPTPLVSCPRPDRLSENFGACAAQLLREMRSDMRTWRHRHWAEQAWR